MNENKRLENLLQSLNIENENLKHKIKVNGNLNGNDNEENIKILNDEVQQLNYEIEKYRL